MPAATPKRGKTSAYRHHDSETNGDATNDTPRALRIRDGAGDDRRHPGHAELLCGQEPAMAGDDYTVGAQQDRTGEAELADRGGDLRDLVVGMPTSGDLGKSEAQMMGDVLEEDEGRLAFADDARDMRPEMARVVRAEPLARDGERLARVARKDDVHTAAPWAAVEGGNVVPDRRVIQGRVFHPRHEHGRGEGFPLDVAHSTVSGAGDVQSEVEPAGTGAERQAEEASVCVARIASGGM